MIDYMSKRVSPVANLEVLVNDQTREWVQKADVSLMHWWVGDLICSKLRMVGMIIPSCVFYGMFGFFYPLLCL